MGYTDASIDRVRAADIVRTIQDSTDLKKEGSNYKGCCPIHNEKTASFVVSPAKQIFKCFGCGEGGDGIKFIMLTRKVEFIQAVEIVAQIHNMFLDKEQLSPDQQRAHDTKAEMYKVLETASRGFVGSYRTLKPDHWAKQMIVDRGYSEESLITFQIGYNDDQNKLTRWAIEHGTLGITKELGLSKTKSDSSYDVFRNRIMFPIHNEKGAVVGFGGRQSNDEKLDKAFKYLNSPTSLVYDKSAVLYGLFQAKHIIAKTGTAILTEGYTDVVAMHQHGCENTVASCGTALTPIQAALIKKYATEIIILRDGDAAGLKAAIRDIDTCLAVGLNVAICILPEGEDPDSFSKTQLDVGTWINSNKYDAIDWKVSQYDFKRDRYDSDIAEIKETANLQIDLIKDEVIDLKNLEGDDLKAAKENNKSIADEINRIKAETAREVKEVPETDPYKKSRAVTEIATTLYLIRNEVKRTEYIKQISKAIKVTVVALKNEIAKLEERDQEEKEKDSKNGKMSMRGIQLPDGADEKEFMEGYGFVTVGNQYFFQNIKDKYFFEGTTFKLEPLFHIQGDKENKRLCEIVNVRGKKKLIDFDSEMLANFNEFKKYLFKIGGFMFLTQNGFRTEHFDRFVYRFEDQFEPALELLTMGQNPKGFYAFANGVYWEGKFRAVNKYGIMHLEGIDQTKDEYNQKIDYYYSPAFSVMHQNNQEGDDLYENDRYFVYKESGITLKQWMNQMVLVFQEKATVGILFNFAAIFRDLFITNYDFFPLLGGFGEKDSGKSGFGKILQNFFYYKLPPLDLTQATHVGFSRRLSRNTNTVQFCDEYQDRNVREEVFNGMMGAWNGIGREKGSGVGTNRTSYDKINSAIYYAGQFMPTRMENALATRTISLLFQSKNFSSEEKERYTKILNWTNSGISSLVNDIVQHRAYFEQRLPSVQSESERILKDLLKKEQYQERIFGNTSVLLTTFRILKDKIEFPFTEQEVTQLCVDLIIDNSDQIADSNGLTEFWNVITFLFEQKIIDKETDFRIESPIDFKITVERNKVNYENKDSKRILFLRLNSVYQHYNKEVKKREGMDVIGETTLRQYFKSRPYFIGLVSGRRFGSAGSHSCYAFDYDMMVKKQIVQLEKDESPDHNYIPIPEGEAATDTAADKPKDNTNLDLPFPA